MRRWFRLVYRFRGRVRVLVAGIGVRLTKVPATSEAERMMLTIQIIVHLPDGA